MRIHEITNPTTKAPTPDQQRMKALNANKQRAADAATQERRRQMAAKAAKAMADANKPMHMPKPPTN